MIREEMIESHFLSYLIDRGTTKHANIMYTIEIIM